MKICLLLLKQKKNDIVEYLPMLVQLVMVTEKRGLDMNQLADILDANNLEKNQIRLSPSLILGIVEWFKGIVKLLEKDSKNIEVNQIMQIFITMC